MKFKEVLKGYTQKSRIFMYPHLDIQRISSILPVQTYTGWDKYCQVEDMKLICLYNLRDDQEFRVFEKTKLTGNKFFCDFKFIEDTRGVYIFDMSEKKEDWNKIITGNYSKLSIPFKNKVLSYFKGSPNEAYIESYLFPEKYFDIYSKIWNCSEQVLRDSGELCDKLNVEKETLLISVKDLDIVNKST